MTPATLLFAVLLLAPEAAAEAPPAPSPAPSPSPAAASHAATVRVASGPDGARLLVDGLPSSSAA